MTARRAGVFLACAFLCTPASAQQPSPTIHITGVVVDAESTPIRRARVDAGVTSTTWLPGFTDQYGLFAVDVPRGTGTLNITKAGFAPELAKVPAGSGGEVSQIRVSMNRAAAITGRLVDTAGTPLMNITVTLRELVSAENGSSRSRNTLTNDLGEFRFGALPAGEFVLQAPAQKDPLRLRAGENVELGDVIYEAAVVPPVVPNRPGVIPRLPAITGTISDEYGEPIQGAFVHVLRITRVDDRLAALSPDGNVFRTSDDRGSYRVFGLRPGKYLIAANVQGYADTYYSATTNIAYAMAVVVDRTDAVGVDITFRPEPTVRVSGIALDSAGQPATGALLLMVSHRSGAIMTQPKVAMLAPDGTFAFDNIPPGDYVLQVSTPINGLRPKVDDGKLMVPRTEFGMRRLTITEEAPPPVLIRTTPGATVRGKVVAEGADAPPRTMAVFPFPADTDQSFAIGYGVTGMTRNDDGSFVITGVTGPRRFTMAAPVSTENWYIKEARVRGADALDSPFDFGLEARELDDVEVVVSPAGAALTGTVTTPGGDPAAEYAVLVFSTDSSKWYRYSQWMRMSMMTFGGELYVNGLPPGSYYVVALSNATDVVTSGDWQDPATLEKLAARASRIDLAEGEKRMLNLRLSAGP